MIGLTEIIVLLLFFGVGILGTIFWVWMIIDCTNKEPSNGNDKIVWTIVIVFTHFIGAFIYFLVRRPVRRSEFGT